jgi:adenylate cyclase
MAEATAWDSTGRPPDRRKLVAVVYADMVGYSRLIGLDDQGTLNRLRAVRQKVIDPAIEEHSGRIVQTGGDSLLVVFDSIDGAVRCALRIQVQIPINDGEQPQDRAIRFRIGDQHRRPNSDGTDLHGDAVNVVARLQAECPPGGICVSRSVRDHVHGRLGLVFRELGALSLKNIDRPIEAFVAQLETPAGSQSVEPSSVSDWDRVSSLARRPSIAILPFANLSSDPEQEYFSDGLADDLITLLSRSRSLFVIARNSSFTYKGRTIDVKQVARELGVRYVVGGSVRRAGGRIRVNAQLIDADTGNHIWAERYDRALQDVFAVQDEIAEALTTAINPAVAEAELWRALRKPPENLGAWEAYQRGLWHVGKATATDNEHAREFFHRAVELDPTFASPHAMLAYFYGWGFASADVLPVRDINEVAEAEAQQALDLDPDDATADAVMSWIAMCNADYRAAIEQADQAISGYPSDAAGWVAT